MNKLIILKLDGDLVQEGFHISLEIADEGQFPNVSTNGDLPPAPGLLSQLNQWKKFYNHLDHQSRIIKPQVIGFDNTLDPFKLCQQEAQKVATTFQEWLNCDGFRPIEIQLRQELTQADTIRILIRTDNPYLHQIPWHLWDMIERYPKAEVAFGTSTFARVSKPSQTSVITELKVLAILGHQTHIDTTADRKLLEKLPSAEVTFLVEPQRQTLTDQLWLQPWDIIFFAGHSLTEHGSGRIFINASESLTLEELKFALRQAIAQGLQLAIFNSCDGLGLAYELMQLNIPQMIVMREPVPDQVAQAFLKYFLHAFSEGKTLYLAEREARERLQALETQFPCASWLPLIFQNPSVTPFIWPESIQPHVSRKQKAITFLRRAMALATIGMISAGSIIGLRLTGLLQPIEFWAFDRIITLRPDDGLDPRLLVVEITEADLQRWTDGSSPFISDQVLTQLLMTLEQAQPTIIGLDIFRDKPVEPGNHEFLSYLQQSDRIIAVCQHSHLKTQGVSPPPRIGDDQVGFNDVVVDPDYIIRRHLIAMTSMSHSDCEPTASFSLLLALNYLESTQTEIQITPDGFLQLGAIVLRPLERGIGMYQSADLAGHQLMLNYRRHHGSIDNIAQTVNLTSVLDGKVSDSAIRDRIVLIGVTAFNIPDSFGTPYNKDIRGLTIHAQMVSQLLSAVLDDRSLFAVWNTYKEGIWIWIWALLGSLVGFILKAPKVILWAIFCLGFSLIILSWFILYLAGVWVSFIPSAIALILGIVGGRSYLNHIEPQTLHNYDVHTGSVPPKN